jgi:hypothetical protein
VSASTLDGPALDAGAFAERLLGQPLWSHQLELVRSSARYRIVCAGRQVGKSRGLAVLALFEASTRRNITVLLVSAGETASRRLLEEAAALASASPLLRGSVLDESKSQLLLSNGSRILSVPASIRQIRGWAVDVLVVDEAAFVDEEVWRAAEPAIIARPGSRVILCSTPWGPADHFFRRLWQRGMVSPDAQVESWHWPSMMSPLVDQVLLEEIRGRENPITFAREYLAEWADDSGALLSADELTGVVCDFELVAPEEAQQRGGVDVVDFWGDRVRRPAPVAGGVDWGMQRDAHALAIVAAVDDRGLNGGDLVFCVPWVEAHHRMPYGAFVDRVVEVAKGYALQAIASETNGVGAYPTEELKRRCIEANSAGLLAGQTFVEPVWTDARRKQSAFGRIKGMVQAGTLVLPRHPELLKQLSSLQVTEQPSGSVAISVPESAGHDDLAMSLAQAITCIRNPMRGNEYFADPVAPVEWVELPSGTRVPLPLRFHRPADSWAFWAPAGGDREVPW